MHDPAPEVAKQVAELVESLRSVEARVAALEEAAQTAKPMPGPISPVALAPAVSAAVDPESSPASPAAALGKCLFVLAGAYLVRALTDSGALPHEAGVALGLAYAMTWLAVADRTGRTESAPAAMAATTWGVTALVIACPLVWEASTRFSVLSPYEAAGVLAAVAATGLAVSARRNLVVLAWASVLSALGTAFVLLVSSRALVAFAVFLVVLAGVAWAISVRKAWPGLPWAPAVAANLVVLEAVWIASRPEGLPEVYRGLSRGTVLALAFALFAVPLAGAIRRARTRAGAPDAFEAFQTGAALFLVVFAISRLNPWTGLSPSLVWCLAGFAAAVAPARAVGSMARVYGAALLLTAGFISGLAGFCGSAFFGSPRDGAPSPDSVLALSLSVVATAFLARRVRAGEPGRAPRAAMFALACLSIVGIGALAEWGLARLVAPDGDPGRTASVRSAVLAAVAVLLASCGRLPWLASLVRLAYPVLAFSALKLVFEDLPHGRPSTLVATFVLYGAALMVVPRLLRRPRT